MNPESSISDLHVNLKQQSSQEKTSENINKELVDYDYDSQEIQGEITVVETGTGTGTREKKPFTILSALALSSDITNSAMAVLVSMQSQVELGGAPGLFYGYIIMAAVGLCSAVSLGELTSTFPHAGGQYHWVVQLCPSRIRRFISYITGILSWAGAVTTCASCTLVTAEIMMGMAKLMHPSLVNNEKPWMIFLVYQALNLAAFPFSCFEKLITRIADGFLYMTITALIIIFVSILAASPTKRSSDFFFVDFFNSGTGWPTGVAFFIGISTANWSFSCLDAATHLVDEIRDPQRNIPKALLLTILVGFVTGIPIIVAIYLSVQNLQDAVNGITGVMSLEVFLQAFSGNKAAAIGLGSLLLPSAFGAIIGVHSWQMRLAWAFSRDKGFPFHKYQARIWSAPFGTPVAAHLWSCSWTGLLGCLYLASSAAFSSFIASGVLLQYITYSIAICLLVFHVGRQNIKNPGPFWLVGRFGGLGLICNLVVVVWTLAALAFYSLPYSLPVEASEMNYVSVVLVFIFLYAITYWVLFGRRFYELPVH